ncbi:LysE family translocator [Paenisporosarcina antarctica]|uniref:LysE family translocator n=1 Tax=Paenisporosarcina antarctica TaxID=417367 RepID=A0A4P6ZVL8_9BACL|nr:LysE family translocator [Paenisporosarcina antarctica]QBP40194.1 LysE family translocator [Paenisporosarcina antarctica]
MFSIVNFEIFILTAILLNLTPGPDTMYIISRSISQGTKAGIYSALGITSGSIVHTLLAAFGLSIILMNSIFLFNTVKIIGAVYLAYLGIKMILARKTTAPEPKHVQVMLHRKIFLQGLIVNITNPKVALFFIAFIPQFISPENSSPLPFLLLGLTFCVTGGIWGFFIAHFSSQSTNKLRGNKNVQFILNKLTGIVFIAMSIKLLKTKATQ